MKFAISNFLLPSYFLFAFEFSGNVAKVNTLIRCATSLQALVPFLAKLLINATCVGT